MPGAPADTADLLARLAAARPDLAGAPHAVLAEGWDSVALDVGGCWIFKFPRSKAAEAALLREAGFLAVLAPRLRLRVPRPIIHDRDGAPFSQHDKIAGEHLLAPAYARLDAARRDRLAHDLATLYADIHAIPPALMAEAGAGPVEPYPAPDRLAGRIETLPQTLHAFARNTVAAWREDCARPPDLVFGQFDGHGWNMAFDHERGVLNGVYDFADAGIGERHRDFSSTNWIDPDLTGRILVHYEAMTGRAVERRRVDLHTAILRLWEHLGGSDIPNSLETLEAWAFRNPG